MILPALSCSDNGILSDSTVRFNVSDTSCPAAFIVYGPGGSSSSLTANLPWSTSIRASNTSVVITANRECDNDGMIFVEIWIDGNLAANAAEAGPFAVAATSVWVN
jgi:hypothetical protein